MGSTSTSVECAQFIRIVRFPNAEPNQGVTFNVASSPIYSPNATHCHLSKQTKEARPFETVMLVPLSQVKKGWRRSESGV